MGKHQKKHPGNARLCHQRARKPIGPIHPRGPGSQDEDTGKGEKARRKTTVGGYKALLRVQFSKLLLTANLAAAGISQA